MQSWLSLKFAVSGKSQKSEFQGRGRKLRSFAERKTTTESCCCEQWPDHFAETDGMGPVELVADRGGRIEPKTV